MKAHILSLIFLLTLFSCLSPDEIVISEDKDLNELQKLIASQPSKIMNTRLAKEVETSKGLEQKNIKIDASFFDRDFEIVNGKDLRRVFNLGSYDKISSDLKSEYKRLANEQNGPLLLVINNHPDGTIRSFRIEEKRKNVLYESGIKSYYIFNQQQALIEYSISGYQKLIGMDSSEHKLRGRISID